jgi:hypothetical protein
VSRASSASFRKISAPPCHRKTGGESPTGSQDRDARTCRSSGRPEKDRKGDTARSKEVKRLRREIGDLKGLLDRQGADIVKLRGKCRRKDDWIAGLEREIGRMCGPYRGVWEETNELSATRSAELSKAQMFLSATDRLSEMEVLSIVRALNEFFYQVAVNLTEEWEVVANH